MTPTDRTYQMLWDCPSCDTHKLLGLTHRFCPNCGAPQDPTLRYFPPQDEAIAVEDHPLVGPDWRCSGCDAPNSERATFCGACGAPRAGDRPVAVRRDVISAQGTAFEGETATDARRDLAPPPAPPAETPRTRRISKTRLGCGCAALLVVGLGLSVAAFFLSNVFLARDTVLVVTGRAWERTLVTEAFKEVTDQAWCDALPAGAHGVSKRREQRSTRRIPDGQDCSDRRVDNGDGTFNVKTECTTRYRNEPVYDDKCTFRIQRWTPEGTARAAGTGLEAPTWPPVAVDPTHREGARQASYTATLSDPGGRVHTCTLDPETWTRMAEGTRWTSKVGRFLENIDCDALKPAP